MRRFLRALRAAKKNRYDHAIGQVLIDYPWAADYEIQPPVNRWHAVHLDSGTSVGTARDITELLRLILADHQSRPLHPRPVRLPLPEHDEEPTQLDIPGWPYRRNAS